MSVNQDSITSRHPSLYYADKIEEICAPLRRFDITYFRYIKNYSDNKHITLCDNKEWTKNFYAKGYHHISILLKDPELHKSGFILWSALQDAKTFLEDAEFGFNIGNGITLVEKRDNYCEFYNFGSSAHNKQIINFYLNNLDVLKRFTMYFKEKARPYIEHAEKIPIKISAHIGQTQTNKTFDRYHLERLHKQTYNIKQKYLKETKINNYKFTAGELKGIVLSGRELDCVLHILQGHNTKETADQLNISPRTVETHLSNIREKLNCSSKTAIKQKLLNCGFEIYKH
ncbi:MAG: helix-turn-helix transcriptional regulator [Gammaproteobacteria bacterium]|nr:helix-turn-helix transcriptional regulator [Gammaproteobacteria bacterium]